jgi:hypothetical protein
MNRFLKGCLIGCGAVILLIVLGAVVFFGWLRSTFGKPQPAAPRIGKSVALRPKITLRSGQAYEAGTAVAVRLQPGGKPILITALHLFGPAGGTLEKDTPPAELEKVVRGLVLTPMGGSKPAAAARGALRKSGPGVTEENRDVSSDLAAFTLLPNSRVNALNLAREKPQLGEWVWLVGDEFQHQPQAQRLFPAQVGPGNDRSGTVRFPKPVELQGFSGAPLVNSKQEVIGILISGGGPIGIYNPAESIRQRLRESGVPGA